jgi:hypothetical protein
MFLLHGHEKGHGHGQGYTVYSRYGHGRRDGHGHGNGHGNGHAWHEQLASVHNIFLQLKIYIYIYISMLTEEKNYFFSLIRRKSIYGIKR